MFAIRPQLKRAPQLIRGCGVTAARPPFNRNGDSSNLSGPSRSLVAHRRRSSQPDTLVRDCTSDSC
jgi:hypothetical protein